ncbi:MAG: permease [Gammaproteobacteria bacterium SG8_11]|nr:MAG: permease [Gammaproteobacteria bacterium SG8_11]
MTTESTSDNFVKNAVEAVIKIAALALIVSWCYMIVYPFMMIVLWAMIIAIAVYPINCWLRGKLGGRNKLSIALITLLGLAILLIPSIMLSASLVESAQVLSTGLKEGTLKVPPPSDKVATWPLIGESVHQYWQLASVNLEEFLAKVGPQLKGFVNWLLQTAAGTAGGILQFVLSIIIAGVFMANATGGHGFAKALGTRLAGKHGEDFADLAGATIRSVAQGVLGVAFIQTLAAAAGLIVMDVPGAGLWALLVLLLAIIQLPPLLILGPIIVYVFSVADTVPAVIFMIWSLIVSGSDAFLKPLLLGRGVKIPMLVILIGAIGGMVVSGIIGLFVGAVVLALGYKLFMAWLYPEKIAEMAGEDVPVLEDKAAVKSES